MKIASVETHVVANPPPGFGGRYFIFVLVTTDDGLVGVGEAYGASAPPGVITGLIHDVADRHLAGRSPFDIESFWRRAYGTGFTLRPDVTLMAAVSALEMACWDIIGKAVGQPVCNLLGGRVHERLRTYTYLYPDEADAVADGDAASVYTDPDAAAAAAVAAVERGFTALKFDPAGPYTVMGGHQPTHAAVRAVADFVGVLRDAVGDRADLAIGTHGQFTSAGALRVAAAIEHLDPLWFEEPVPPDNIDECARVARGTSIPVAAGERLTTKYEFARLLERGAAAIVQPNLGRCGGVLEAKKIGAIAETHGALVAPHLYCGPVVAAANIAVAVTLPNFLVLESIGDLGGFHAELLHRPIEWESGSVIPPTEPGLGVSLDLDVVVANRYTGDDLHLTMWEDPIGEVGPRDRDR